MTKNPAMIVKRAGHALAIGSRSTRRSALIGRRTALARLGLGATAAYLVPSLFILSEARAASASGPIGPKTPS